MPVRVVPLYQAAKRPQSLTLGYLFTVDQGPVLQGKSGPYLDQLEFIMVEDRTVSGAYDEAVEGVDYIIHTAGCRRCWNGTLSSPSQKHEKGQGRHRMGACAVTFGANLDTLV